MSRIPDRPAERGGPGFPALPQILWSKGQRDALCLGAGDVDEGPAIVLASGHDNLALAGLRFRLAAILAVLLLVGWLDVPAEVRAIKTAGNELPTG